MSPTSPAPTIVSLTFDDGRASQDLARRMLADHGLPGTFYVNSGRMGQPGFLTWEQMDELAEAGHEVGGHTISHPDLTTITAEHAHREVAGDREELLARGHAATTFAYPYGEGHADRAVRAAVESAGYTVARRAWGLHARGRPDAETVPPGDPWAIKTPDGVRAEMQLEALQAIVTAAERGGGWVPLVFHDVGDGWGDGWSVSPGTFDELLGWLVGRGTAVRTVAQVVC